MAKRKKGYFVHGEFVERGSEQDAELKSDQVDSKTAVKRQMEAVQQLGADLVELKEGQIKKLPASEALVDAILMAKGMPKREARRRQLQYIGKLMRKEDVEALQQAWNIATTATPQAQAHTQVLENWRERLIADDAAVQEWVEAHPATDVQRLRSVIRQARKDKQAAQKAQEKAQEKLQKESQDGASAPSAESAAPASKAYKQLFQLLKEWRGEDSEDESGDDA